MKNDCDIGEYPFTSEWTNSWWPFLAHMLELSGLSMWLLTDMYKIQYKFGYRGSLLEGVKCSLSISSVSWPHEREVETVKVPDDVCGLQVHKGNIHKICMAWDAAQAIQPLWNCAGVVYCLSSLHFLLTVLNTAKNILISSISWPRFIVRKCHHIFQRQILRNHSHVTAEVKCQLK